MTVITTKKMAHASQLSIIFLCLGAFWLAGTIEAMGNHRLQGSQTRGQDRRQPGLTPEKKRSLSNYGPEDVFPGESGDRQQERSSSRPAPARRNSRPASANSTTPQSTPTPLPVLSSTPDVKPSIMAPTNAEPAGVTPQMTNNVQAPPGWLLPTLAAVTLLVLTAFLYTVYKLYEKLRVSGR